MSAIVWLLVAVRLGLGTPEAKSYANESACWQAAEKRIADMAATNLEPEEPFAFFCTQGRALR